MSSGTRPATRDDLEALAILLRAFHNESPMRHVAIDEAKGRQFLEQCINNPGRACIVYDSGSVDGVIIGYAAEYYFSKEKAAWDLVVYVRPERRGSLVAYRLISAFREWAKSAGAQTLWLGTAAGVDPNVTRKFYRGIGMEEVGAIYRLDLRNSAPAGGG